MVAEEPDPRHAELRALQRRAYGPDADIHSDPAALARLQELEGSGPRPEPGPAPESVSESAPEPVPPLREDGTPAPRGVPLRPALLASGIALLLLVALGLGATMGGAGSADTAAEIEESRQRAAEAAERRLALDADLPRRTVYDLYLDGKRDEVLTLPGAEGVASRMIREDFRPYGRLYGRLVGAGPTRDDRFCMIIENEPTAAAACLSSRTPWEVPITLVFPAPQFDASSPGAVTYVGYTLRSDGGVVARPGADPATAADPEPTRTAVPAPGTQ